MGRKEFIVIQSKKSATRLVMLLAITYMVSYITRINFGAIVSEIERGTGLSKSVLSMSLTGSFVTYGVGQVISGFFGDRISPKRLVTYGLIITMLMNFLIPICGSYIWMLIVWSMNGFAQAFMWPPMVKLMTAFFQGDEYRKATTRISWGSSFGTMFVYLLSPLIISVSGWKTVFIFCGLCAGVMMLVWNRHCPDTGVQVKTTAAADVPGEKQKLFTPLILAIMAAIVLQGALRDGITTWMPSYITETYHINNLISVLSGVILPVFSILCVQIAGLVYGKHLHNPLLCSGIYFGIGILASVLLLLFSGQSVALSVICAALLTGMMHGVNMMLISILPSFFQKQGKVSLVAGILNSCTYVGSALSTYVIAVLAEMFGWNVNLIVWLGITIVGTVLCGICVKPWKRQYMS